MIIFKLSSKFCVVKITQGGGVAAPVAGQILSEVLPYLEITNQKQEIQEFVEMPNITGLTFKEAKSVIKEIGLTVEPDETITDESIITDQLPTEGIQIMKGTKIILYSN